MNGEIKCDGCEMEATEDRWDYAMLYPARRSPGDTRARKIKVLVCPACGKTRTLP